MSDDDDEKKDEAATWSVWRQDDHGNRFLVATRLKRQDAENLVAELESRGHKQTYWAEEDRRTGGPPAFVG
jgi:hypothetical protein